MPGSPPAGGDARDPGQGAIRPAAALYELVRGLLRFDGREHLRLLGFLARWTVLGTVVGLLAGVGSAVFLALLALVTETRVDNPWLLGLLPVGGFVVGLAYHYGGGRSSQGNNLILEEVHGIDPDGSEPPVDQRWVPRRMAPLVLGGTLVTHLLGGSAGREGTAIQMSGSLTDALARLVRLPRTDRHLLLVAAIAGGFGSVFGVPLAGALFALEVQTVGRIRHDALVPALVASIVGDRVVHVLDWPHDLTPRVELASTPVEAGLLAKVVVAGLVFGLVSAVFSELVVGLKRAFATLCSWSPLRPVVGGTLVVALTLLVGTDDHLGLSLPLIERSYLGEVVVGAFAIKLVFTAITLGSGFQGGEVTPLFVIGATLGATLAQVLDAPVELFAAVGLVAVFAGATNTPIACSVMGLELFGPGALLYLAVGCTVSFVFSAHRGIYETQRVETGPGEGGDRPGRTLADVHAARRLWLPDPRKRRRGRGRDAEPPGRPGP